MICCTLPKDPVHVVGVIEKSSGIFVPIGIFESLNDAAAFAARVCCAYRIEPYYRDSVMLRDMKVSKSPWEHY